MKHLLINTYIFYADIYFIQNFMIKTAVLYLALLLNKLPCHSIQKIGKIVCASFLGTMIEIAGLLLGNSYQLFLALVHLLEIPLMAVFVLGKDRRRAGGVITAGYFFVMVINAVLEILWNYFGQQQFYILLLAAACATVYFGIRIWQNYTKMQKGIFPVEIRHGEKSVHVDALYDSGNGLKDPYTGKGVHIISEQLLAELAGEEEKTVYIPYQSLGNESGLIKVYYLESLKIQKNEEILEKTGIPAGAAEEKLFQNKRYQMILNEDVW